ncbi:MAG: hypothetical protein Kow00122_07110 [Thermoleophilia bacterium]
MTSVFYLTMFVLVVFVLGFIGYYVWRLLQVRRVPDDTAARFQAFMRQAGGSGFGGPVAGDPGAGYPAGWSSGVLGSAGARPAGGRRGGEAAGESRWGQAAAAGPRVYERKVGLRRLSADPVFLRRDATGEVVYQVGDRPPMPLKYLLDPSSRKVLQEVVGQASVDFGPSWAILAGEDAEGRLTITRLS